MIPSVSRDKMSTNISCLARVRVSLKAQGQVCSYVMLHRYILGWKSKVTLWDGNLREVFSASKERKIQWGNVKPVMSRLRFPGMFSLTNRLLPTLSLSHGHSIILPLVVRRDSTRALCDRPWAKSMIKKTRGGPRSTGCDVVHNTKSSLP